MPEQRITSIEVQQRRSSRRSIFLDGEFALGVDGAVIADLGLRVGQIIAADELQRIVHLELINKAKERALKLLDFRARSKTELSRRLKMAGYEDDVIEEVLGRFQDLGLINDEQFSDSWIRHRLEGKPMGKTRIKWELRQKGVDNETAEAALSQIDGETEYRLAVAAAGKRWEKDNDPDTRARRRRVASYLQRQGFGWEVVSRAMNDLCEENETEDNSK